MTYVLALVELNHSVCWRVVCHHMPTNSEFAFFKKFYGLENLCLTSDTRLALVLSADEVPFCLG